MKIMPRLTQHILDRDANPVASNTCSCGSAKKRLVQCDDCISYETSCTECFIAAHQTLPFHWARVWDDQHCFFVRCDISRLRLEGYAHHLGHHGALCPNPASHTDLFFQVVDTNGIHDTKIRFCGCSNVDRVDQLMRAGLFPATVDRPTMAFTLTVLKQFHLHHLESKESAYDFIGALRRLTDNAFAHEVAVSNRIVIQRHILTFFSIESLFTISSCDACISCRYSYEASWTGAWHR
jgi:hypothetical protein